MALEKKMASEEMLRRITMQLADNSSRQDGTITDLMKIIAGQKTKGTHYYPSKEQLNKVSQI